jgi:hypothetical protein
METCRKDRSYVGVNTIEAVHHRKPKPGPLKLKPIIIRTA